MPPYTPVRIINIHYHFLPYYWSLDHSIATTMILIATAGGMILARDLSHILARNIDDKGLIPGFAYFLWHWDRVELPWTTRSQS